LIDNLDHQHIHDKYDNLEHHQNNRQLYFKKKSIRIQKKIEWFFFIPIQLKRVERGFLIIVDEPELVDMISVVVTK